MGLTACLVLSYRSWMTTKKIRATDLKSGMVIVHSRGNIDVSSVIEFGSGLMSVLGHRTRSVDTEYIHREQHWSPPVVRVRKEDRREEVFFDLKAKDFVEVVDKV